MAEPALAEEAAGAAPCPLCGSTDFRPDRRLRDNRTAVGSYTIAICSGCGVFVVRPAPRPERMAELYHLGYGPYVPPTMQGSRPGRLARLARRTWHVIDGMPTLDRSRSGAGSSMSVPALARPSRSFGARASMPSAFMAPSARLIDLIGWDDCRILVARAGSSERAPASGRHRRSASPDDPADRPSSRANGPRDA
jgi:hypothetical protein